MDSNTFLFDVSPFVMERFCNIMDAGESRFSWRELAVRILSSLLEVRLLERVEASGRSPTRELLWSWSQQNPRLQDLLRVLQDMGHDRALQLFQDHIQRKTAGEHDDAAQSPRNQHREQHEGSVQLQQQLTLMKTAADDQSDAITFQDVIEGTRGFHPDTRVSEGRFSDVYRAQSRNRTFAVKLFKQINNTTWKGLWEIFQQEMQIHRLYKHPNILDPLGCFSDEDRYCLVYPYLHNGSLFHRLHHRDAAPPLSWQERLSIIKGAAEALHHLHTGQRRPVICGNVCSANVLLDDTLQPKLSDFGLAHLRPYAANQHWTVTLDAGSHGNLGYLPEEYIRDRKLSFSLDVYSFGMILMETLTGRKVVEEEPKPTLLRNVLSSEVDCGGVDSCLRLLDVSAGSWPTAVALGLLQLALDCTTSRHRSRPSMKSVLVLLSQLLPAEQPCSLEHNEQTAVPASPPQTHSQPCECSQSEVTYLSETAACRSWPVQCSCSDSAPAVCDDCRANGFSAERTHS